MIIKNMRLSEPDTMIVCDVLIKEKNKLKLIENVAEWVNCEDCFIQPDDVDYICTTDLILECVDSHLRTNESRLTEKQICSVREEMQQYLNNIAQVMNKYVGVMRKEYQCIWDWFLRDGFIVVSDGEKESVITEDTFLEIKNSYSCDFIKIALNWDLIK